MKNLLVFVLYDGIENSVFESQVLQPLINKIEKKLFNNILLISFEKKTIPNHLVATIKKNYGINIIFLKRWPFMGTKTLVPAIVTLKNILKNLTPFELYARGPHAGWISLQAAKNTRCTHITIQARGLLAEEYAYVHRNKKNPFYILHQLRKDLFYRLEKKIYGLNTQSLIPITIEVVSPALKEYLIKEFNTKSAMLKIAQEDIPPKIDMSIVHEWRTTIRKKLGIPHTSHIYCYNGSAKSWQCPEQVIHFFKKELEKDTQAFLLLLSQDKKIFEQLLKKYNIDPSRFYVTSVAHKEIYRYLAAADAGLLFREKNIINWVSRPTKALEYKAVGLEIIHNNSVGWLQQ